LAAALLHHEARLAAAPAHTAAGPPLQTWTTAEIDAADLRLLATRHLLTRLPGRPGCSGPARPKYRLSPRGPARVSGPRSTRWAASSSARRAIVRGSGAPPRDIARAIGGSGPGGRSCSRSGACGRWAASRPPTRPATLPPQLEGRWPADFASTPRYPPARPVRYGRAVRLPGGVSSPPPPLRGGGSLRLAAGEACGHGSRSGSRTRPSAAVARAWPWPCCGRTCSGSWWKSRPGDPPSPPWARTGFPAPGHKEAGDWNLDPRCLPLRRPTGGARPAASPLPHPRGHPHGAVS